MAFVGTEDWQFLLADNANATIADLSDYVLDPVVSPRLSVPSHQTWTVPLTPTVLGLGTFEAGLHRGIAIRNGTCVANDILWRVKPAGGPNSGYATLEFEGPMRRWERRYCQDVDGQIFYGVSADGTDHGMDLPLGIVADPELDFAAGDMLGQALENTIANDGDLGITLGTFSTTPITGSSVIFKLENLTPLRISELMTMFRETGTLDVTITPTSAAGTSQGTVSGVNLAGTDLPGVAFDYGAGANNIAWAYPETTMDEFCNQLWYEIGKRKDTNHYSNNVTQSALTTTDPAASQAAYGVYHDIQIQTGWPGEILTKTVPATIGGVANPAWAAAPINPVYELYLTSWNHELAARMAPRQLIRIVPQPGVAPEPWTAYNLGDTPRLNLGQLGLDVSGAEFRIIGWDARPQNDGPENVELLIGWAPE